MQFGNFTEKQNYSLKDFCIFTDNVLLRFDVTENTQHQGKPLWVSPYFQQNFSRSKMNILKNK